MATRVYYEMDPFNRLIVGSLLGRKSRVKKFRRVIYGKFSIDENNALFYEINKSSGIDIPQKIKFSGVYSLDKNHNLVMELNKWNNQCEGNRLLIKAKLIDAKSNEIALLVNSKVTENKSLSYIMKLHGLWRADKYNRLAFQIERENNKPDTLTLSGAWEINKNNEIIYKYGRDGQMLTFKGYWDMQDKYRLRYALDKKINSAFNFKSSFGTIAPKGKDVYVTFDIGIGVSGLRRLHRKIIFSGRWKINKYKELVFETSDIKEGGLSLRFTKEMFDKKGVLYIESIIKGKERFIGGGLAFNW